LEAFGLRCELDVGTSDFRIPLAVLDPNDTQRYILGLLLDEAPAADSVFERYLHIPNVLALRGWNLMRVNPREWDLQQAQVIQAICKRVADGSPQ
jgi:hypothetical protein